MLTELKKGLNGKYKFFNFLIFFIKENIIFTILDKISNEYLKIVNKLK